MTQEQIRKKRQLMIRKRLPSVSCHGGKNASKYLAGISAKKGIP
ncbi:hypothetical protein HMPREF3039_02307 [Akkermansia sp. KLE1798]|nr:hypothetical protein HMPREF3039_02307 [Akkermansia sp. KLE1798]KZA05778.1 hypothetical protein HMPREF1326_00605 [Akkermansia sp. KLE1605]